MGWWANRQAKSEVRKLFQKLTPNEKSYLRSFASARQRGLPFRLDDPVATSLMAAGFLSCPKQYAAATFDGPEMVMMANFYITDLVWDLVQEEKRLLKTKASGA
jgi:hypothetical protein